MGLILAPVGSISFFDTMEGFLLPTVLPFVKFAFDFGTHGLHELNKVVPRSPLCNIAFPPILLHLGFLFLCALCMTIRYTMFRK
jgi:hypothetical protein